MTKEEVIDYLSNLSVLEIAGLVKDLEEKWGVSAAAPVAVARLPRVPPHYRKRGRNPARVHGG